MEKLAILGGKKVRNKPFPPHPIIEKEEQDAVLRVLRAGRLSSFIASKGHLFFGGEYVLKFEKEFAKYFNTKYAVSMNSATACLHAALAAIEIGEGDEVIVPPYTFTSTASSVLMQKGTPVFVDIDPDTFCLDPNKIEEKITKRTKAIIIVHLFGRPADMDGILSVAKKHNIKVIEDCAQSPGASYKGRLVGTLGDIGVFSFTESKTITTGEGGMLITNNEKLARIAQMVRNHGEALVEGRPRSYESLILGWNYRMPEIESALGRVQLRKLIKFNNIRIELCNYLSKNLKKLDFLEIPENPDYIKNVFYVYPLKYQEEKIDIKRDTFIKALNAEGIPIGGGYVRPLYLNAIFNQKGKKYGWGTCPVTERLYKKEMMLIAVCRPYATKKDMDDIIKGFEKIIENISQLKKWEVKNG